MKKNDCIFCKIANGEIPSETIYEDENFRAILDIAPTAKGHTLIIPKEHADNLLMADDEMLSKLLVSARKLASAIKDGLGCDGINVLQNNGEAAWQSVHHLHVHLIPRYKDDDLKIPWKTLSYEEGEAAEYSAKIKAKL